MKYGCYLIYVPFGNDQSPIGSPVNCEVFEKVEFISVSSDSNDLFDRILLP